MTNQWHMPTADCVLPAGTRLGVGDGCERELLEPCRFVAGEGFGSANNAQTGGMVMFRKGPDLQPLLTFELVVFAVLLPEAAMSEIRPGR